MLRQAFAAIAEAVVGATVLIFVFCLFAAAVLFATSAVTGLIVQFSH